MKAHLNALVRKELRRPRSELRTVRRKSRKKPAS